MAEWHQLPARDDENASGGASSTFEWNELNRIAQVRAKNSSRNQSAASLPDLGHLTSEDFQHVYEPSDDTFLLMDAIKHDIQSGRWDCNEEDHESAEPDLASTPSFESESSSSSLMVVLEIGCGSGVPSVVFRTEWCDRYYDNQRGAETSELFGPENGGPAATRKRRPRTNRQLVSFATDVNPTALHVAQRTAQANPARHHGNGVMEFVQCDLASPLLSQLEGRVDVILFNPPYVPTPDDEVSGCGIEASWAGGENGRRVIDRFVPHMARLLSKPQIPNEVVSGVAYLITVDDNCPHELAQLLRREYGFVMTPWFRRRAFNEQLTVQRITWEGGSA